MIRKSTRLRCLTFGMRCFVKPALAYLGSPEGSERRFERVAPLLFSVPKGTETTDFGPCKRVTFGTPRQGRAIFYIHGGAFVAGSSCSYRAMAGRLAKRTGAPVFLADYPKLQDAPFPAAPLAVLKAWDHLLAKGWAPNQIVLMGDSAGGNLVFGLLAQLLERGETPAGVVAFSPWVDLTLRGNSLSENARKDPFLPVRRMPELIDLYLAGASADHPLASPVFAAFPNPPPVLIQVGEDEILRSDAEKMAQKTAAKLQVWPHVPHVWQIFDGRLPEANAAMREAAAFVQMAFDKVNR